MNELGELKDIIPNDFYKKLNSSKTKFRNHPLKTIIYSLENPNITPSTQKYAKYTLNSIINIKNNCKYKTWFDKKWDKILSLKDNYNAAIGLLAEIRTLNELIDTQFSIYPINEKNKGSTPDFKANKKDNDNLFLEVYTPRMKSQAIEKKKKIYNNNYDLKNKPVKADIVKFNPVYGEEKSIEFIINIIGNRILGNKKQGKQVQKNACNLLWVDLISNEWNIDLNSTLPYISKKFKDTYITGNYGLWQSIYGKKGMKILKRRVWLKFANDLEFKDLNKDGYFRNYSKWSGIILAFTDGIVLYQNPWAENKLSEDLLKELIRLKKFNMFYSWISSNNINLIKKINLKIQEIDDIYNLVTN